MRSRRTCAGSATAFLRPEAASATPLTASIPRALAGETSPSANLVARAQRVIVPAVIVYAVVDDALSPDFPLGDAVRCSSAARTPSGCKFENALVTHGNAGRHTPGELLRGSLDPEIEVDAMAFNDGFMLAGLALHNDPSVENLCADLRDNRDEVDLRGLIGVRVTDRVPRLRHRGRFTPFGDASP